VGFFFRFLLVFLGSGGVSNMRFTTLVKPSGSATFFPALLTISEEYTPWQTKITSPRQSNTVLAKANHYSRRS